VLAAAVEALNRPPDPELGARAQKRLRTDWHRTARDANVLAFEIGHFQTMDRWQTLPEYLQARDDATPDDIARVAALYFVPDNRSVGVARSRTPRGRPATEDQP
jgi:predicted Zn-dependent peptidase